MNKLLSLEYLENDIDKAIIEERNEEIKIIKEDLLAIKELAEYMDMDLFIQGKVVENAKESVTHSDGNIEKGKKNIEYVHSKSPKSVLKSVMRCVGGGIIGGTIGTSAGIPGGPIGMAVGGVIGTAIGVGGGYMIS